MTDESLFWHFSAASNKSHQQERKKKKKCLNKMERGLTERSAGYRLELFIFSVIIFLFFLVVTPFRKKR